MDFLVRKTQCIRYFHVKLFNLIFGKTRRAVRLALLQGLKPSEIAWAVSCGVIVGVFPIYGTTMLLLALVGFVKKWNHVLLQAANWMVSPLKPLLILPHIRLGEWIFSPEQPFQLSLAEFTRRFQEAPLDTLGDFSMTFVHAIAAWGIHAPVSLLLVYLITRMILTRFPADLSTREHPEPEGSLT